MSDLIVNIDKKKQQKIKQHLGAEMLMHFEHDNGVP